MSQIKVYDARNQAPNHMDRAPAAKLTVNHGGRSSTEGQVVSGCPAKFFYFFWGKQNSYYFWAL